MNSVANSPWMYALGIIVFLFVLFTSFAFIFRSYKQAKMVNMDKKVIKKTIVTSIVFSLLPSISILIGVITLSGSLGIPFPWIRLSVIGALHYEMTAASVANPLGLPTLAEMTAKQFVTTASVMTIFILSGPIFCLIAFKGYDKKLLSKAKASTEVSVSDKPVEKKKTFGPYLFSAAFIALISSFLAEGIAKIKDVGKIGQDIIKDGEIIGKYSALDTFTPIVVILVSFGSMALFDLIAKKAKAKWLDDFALGFSMILGMASAVIIEVIMK